MFGKNKRKKKSLVITILLSIWALYVTVSGVQYWHDTKKLAQDEIERRKNTVNYFLKSATAMLIEDKIEPLKASMQEAQDLKLVDFYILQKDDKVEDFRIVTGKLEDINHDYQNFNVFMQDENVIFKTIKLYDYRLTAGTYANAYRLMTLNLWRNIDGILRDIGLVTAILWGAVLFLLKDLFQLSKVLKTGNRKSLRNLKGTSAEADVLVSATQGYEQENALISATNETYAQTVGPAILAELNSGKEAPYSFESLMIRVDLNGYTQMYMDKQEDLTSILNDYFAQAREVISRYDGLIYQFVGDEIVFHIKENDKKDAALKACLCIKGLFEEAQILEKKYALQDPNFVFKLKASWSRGKLRFIKLDQGHAFSGLPLIESVRLLSQIDNKNLQFLAIQEPEYAKIKDSVLVFSRADVLLKGFAEASHVVRIKDFLSLKDVLKLNHWDRASYYRSNSDISMLFKEIRNRWKVQEDIPWDMFLYDLSQVKFVKTSEKLKTDITDFVHFVLDDMWKKPKEIATVISSIPYWWGEDEPSAELCEALLKFLDHRDPRIRANTLLTLGHFEKHVHVIEEAIFDHHNRVAADALLALGKMSFSNRVAKRLEKMHETGNLADQKSAEFVMQSLVEHYLAQDPVFFAANNYLKSWQESLSQKQNQSQKKVA